jgi:serine/threonine protein kinase
MPRSKGDERYELTKKLGSGGCGVVYLANDLIFGGVVAIKVLHSDTVAEQTVFTKLLLNEAKLQAKLSNSQKLHPNIVCFIDVRRLEDGLGVVMEFIDGGSVAEMLGPRNRKIALPPGQAVEIALGACEALVAAHAAGIIHRDIKPGNMLIRKADGVCKVADWGIAKNIDLAGDGRTFTGTPPYMAEEVILLKRSSPAQIMKGEGVDHRTDIYALGVTLFEMLAAKYPFDSENEALTGVTKATEQMLTSQHVEKDLTRVVLKAIALKSADRFSSAAELQTALRTWQSRHQIGDDLAAAWKLYKDRRDTAGAERGFLGIIDRYQDNPQVYLELARFYTDISREDAAIQLLEKGKTLAPRSAQIWRMLGWLLAKRNNEGAVPALERALKLGLPDAEARIVRRMLDRIKNDFGKEAGAR